MPLPSECPECGGISLMNKGFGTEKVEAVLKSIFKENKIERFDRDEIKTTKDLNDKLERFHSGEIDIFVGTQMLAKGHNFRRVNLVVVLGIDSMLNYADFRSSEKTYQLIEQVAGRSGRYTDDSEVLIQTINPEHSVFKLIGTEKLEEFYRQEIPLREICMCPPFAKIAMIYFSSRFRERLVSQINSAFKTLTELSENHFSAVKLYGPSPMGIEKKANQYTWGIMLKSQDFNHLHGLISTFDSNYIPQAGLTYKLDIDPMHIL